MVNIEMEAKTQDIKAVLPADSRELSRSDAQPLFSVRSRIVVVEDRTFVRVDVGQTDPAAVASQQPAENQTLFENETLLQVDRRFQSDNSITGNDIRPVNTNRNNNGHAQLTSNDARAIAAAAQMSRTRRIPLVLRIVSASVNLTDGVDALHNWGAAVKEVTRCSGVVPIIVITNGPNVSGTSLLLGLADFVIMTEASYAFVVGPRIVQHFTGVDTSRDELGGCHTHYNNSGLATFVTDDMTEADEILIELLSYVSEHNDADPPAWICTDPVSRSTPEVLDVLPESLTGSYDVRDIVCGVVDDGVILELNAGWADNLVTAFATIGGRSIGVVANQPQSKAGTLDIAASRKGGRFVSFCDAFNLSLVTFVDTSGFYPGKDLEWRGMIRYGAQMAFAYARATVPRVNVTLRKSYGGAYIVMDSKAMGNDIALAWPSAEIAVMGAKGAVSILHRNASPEEAVELEAEYEERLLNPYLAAERGFVDAVIDPADTRKEIYAALEMLAAKRERLPHRRHGNTPL